MPEAAALSALRRSIDRKPEQLKTVLSSAGIRKEFLGGVSKDRAKIVKKFVDEHKETSLKTRPKVSLRHHSFFVVPKDLRQTCTVVWSRNMEVSFRR
jgi:hypothetical protein